MTDEPTPFPGAGRRHRHTTRVQLGDAAPDGRARFDALARWLQDAAYEDVLDGGAAEDGAWVVRSQELFVERFPRLGEALALDTWCDGLGRRHLWARRRTSVHGVDGARVEAVATWVHLDPASGRPRPLSEAQLALWAESAGGRVVKARRELPPPPPGDVATVPFVFRASDLDVAGHVNNAVYWCALVEGLGAVGEPVHARIEHAAATGAGVASVARAGDMTWVLRPTGEPCASIRIQVGRTLQA